MVVDDREKRYGKELAQDLKLIVVLSRCMQSVGKRLFPNIRLYGLTPAQFDVLEVLYHKGPVTMNMLIEKTLSSSGNTGVVVQNLIRDGLITKSVDVQDKRVRQIELTNAGRETFHTCFQNHVKELADAFSGLSETEKQQLTELLKMLGKSV